jgi:hypothetical protein
LKIYDSFPLLNMPTYVASHKRICIGWPNVS